jgi:RloB-like protein
MPPTNRNYKKGAPHRDSRLFVIVAEGEREDEYFSFFHEKNQRVRIQIVPREGNASAPKHFLERLSKFQEEGSWIPKENDTLWFVLDVDRWKKAQINELISACEQDKNWNIAISNPCFEVWLLYHVLDNLDGLSNNLKNELRNKAGGSGYSPETFCVNIATAIENAKQNDLNPKHLFPDKKQTKIYLLAEQLLEKLGKNWK